MNAVIDIGSNSVRLCIDRGLSVNPKMLNTTQLAENLEVLHRLDEKAMARTFAAVTEFYAMAKQEGADKVYVFGTEAMRCEGGETLKKMIETAIPVKVDIISGEKEALLGYIGATENKGNCAVIDIGGASVELTAGNHGKISYAQSLKIGVVRAKDAVGSRRTDIENFYKTHATEFQKVSADKCIAIGGTATSLASMLLGQKNYDANAVHGYVINRRDLEEMINRIFSSENLTEEFPTIGVKRAGVIGHGAIILSVMMDYLGFEKATVSEHDNIEGYLLSLQNLTASD